MGHDYAAWGAAEPKPGYVSVFVYDGGEDQGALHKCVEGAPSDVGGLKNQSSNLQSGFVLRRYVLSVV